MPDQKIRIIADDREIPSGIPAMLRCVRESTVEIERFSTGDYIVGDRVVIERKTLEDFVESVVDGRLFRQASKMAKSRWRPLLLLEGDMRPGFPTDMRREAIDGALLSVTLAFNVAVIYSENAEQSGKIIAYCAGQLARGGSGVFRFSGRSPKCPEARKLRVLQALPGIGRMRAKDLLRHFGSVEKCVSAGVKAIAEVEGVGKKTAQRIRNVVNEPPVPYISLRKTPGMQESASSSR